MSIDKIQKWFSGDDHKIVTLLNLGNKLLISRPYPPFGQISLDGPPNGPSGDDRYSIVIELIRSDT